MFCNHELTLLIKFGELQNGWISVKFELERKDFQGTKELGGE
jgi:hypothetical protein